MRQLDSATAWRRPARHLRALARPLAGHGSSKARRGPGARLLYVFTLRALTTIVHKPIAVASTEQSSCQRWLADLSKLRHDARRFFGDVCWAAPGPAQRGRSCSDDAFVYAHKAIVYSRSSGSFQERFIQCAPALHCSDSVASSINTGTSARDEDTRGAHLLRSSSSASLGSMATATTSSATLIAESRDHVMRLMLTDTDPTLFEAWLDVLYLGAQDTEGMHVLFEGFHESIREDSIPGLTGIAKLREDLLYCWRSKLYSDVTIVLDDGGEDANSSSPFASHRAILAARVPYFASILLADFSDARSSILTLPSPLFSSASFTFILGYVYSGTLHFSSRKFDLTTALEIWRGATFLGLDHLQEQAEVSIESMMTPSRAARIYRFALAPDVRSARLARDALQVITDHFGQVWDSAYIGTLDYPAQKALFHQVCSGITAETSTSVVKQALQLRKRIEANRHGWVHHIRAMLDAVEEHLIEVLSRDLAAVVTSVSFVDLIDGVGFSADALEHLLELVVRGLAESRACATYQALVGSVLLREEGILIDARMLVEDARNGIARYIKTRWMSIRDAGEFTKLQTWCLKELADDISIPEAELIYQPTALKQPPIRTSVTGSSSKLVLKQTAQRQLPSSANQSKASIAKNSQSSDSVTLVRAQIVDVSGSSAYTDPPRNPARAYGRPSGPLPAASHACSGGPTLPTANHSLPSFPASNAPFHRPPVGQRGALGSTSAPLAPAANRARASSTTHCAVAVRTRLSGSDISPNLASDLSTPSKPRSMTGSTDSKARHTSSGQTDRPSTNPAPTSVLGRSIASRNVSQGAPIRSPATLQDPSNSRSSSKSNTQVTPSCPRKSVRRTPSAVSLNSVQAPSNRPTTPSSKKSFRSPDSNIFPPVPKPPHSAKSNVQDRTINEGALATYATRDAEADLLLHNDRKPRGTTLLAGIPCIATISNNCERRVQIRAVVRYIGPVEWSSSDVHWVGVEVAKGDIPAEVEAIYEWNDGSRNGFRYFKLGHLRSSLEPATRRNTGKAEQAEYQPELETGEAPFRGRPHSNLGVYNAGGDSGEASRGLFVRPSSIVYVL
ncbi:BQ2448_5152 [Microbotryum intermedium]|uniref:BQ2448_5152 protein n=1 Tax=Microbotryum intermedium TaxID=269621 RepID=A0A238F693_9BASI|nr:BQ2448_5152 [Microbotryum intermedium]